MEHHFTVPVPIDVAWAALLDPERVAPCMPGATLTSVQDSDFTGSVKVKMGPVSLMYKGTGSFSKIDVERHRVVIEASGKDARGNGTASATVTALLAPEGAGGDHTDVRVDTDLKVTGKPAQLGRGLISEVAGKLLNQFADCLADRLQADEQDAAPTVSASGAAAPSGSPASTNGQPAASGGQSGPAPAGPATEPEAPPQRPPSWKVTAAEPGASESGTAAAPASDTAQSGSAQAPSPAGERASERPSEKADAVVEGTSVPSGEAIDLLGTAGAPVLKRLVPAVAAVAALAGAVVLARRRRGRGRRR